jgi:hypothetical protein
MFILVSAEEEEEEEAAGTLASDAQSVSSVQAGPRIHASPIPKPTCKSSELRVSVKRASGASNPRIAHTEADLQELRAAGHHLCSFTALPLQIQK